MFGQKLKMLRTSKKLNQSELSKILGVSSSTVGMYEQGRRFPDQIILTKIADYFDVTTDYLLGRTQEKNINYNNLPTQFHNAKEAMEFILKIPTVMAYGGYDAASLSDDEIIDFANDLLQQFELISYKYKNK